MVTVTFADFKDSALKFDNQAYIAFVVDTDSVWVKTGNQTKHLCYKEAATITGLEEGKTIKFCLDHASVQKGLAARINSNSIENEVSFEIDPDANKVTISVKHSQRIPAHDNVPEKVEVLGCSKRGPFHFASGTAPKSVMNYPISVPEDVRAELEEHIDILPSKSLAEIFDKLGVVKLPIFIAATREDEEHNIIPAKAFVCGNNLYGVMPMVAFKRGVKVSYELTAPVGKLLAKDNGNAECLARKDAKTNSVIFTVQTDEFFVSGMIDKLTKTSVNIMYVSQASDTDYTAFTFKCPRALLANVPTDTQLVKVSGNSLYVGEDSITMQDLTVNGELGDTISKMLEKGLKVDFSSLGKLLPPGDSVPIAIGIVDNEDTKVGVMRIGDATLSNVPCWYLLATPK